MVAAVVAALLAMAAPAGAQEGPSTFEPLRSALAAVIPPEIFTPGEGSVVTGGSFALGGRAPVGSAVTLYYDGDQLLAEGVLVDDEGTWSTEVQSPPDGTHAITATATLGGETSEPSKPRTVTFAGGGGVGGTVGETTIDDGP